MHSLLNAETLKSLMNSTAAMENGLRKEVAALKRRVSRLESQHERLTPEAEALLAEARAQSVSSYRKLDDVERDLQQRR
jgi:hypothetical protein